MLAATRRASSRVSRPLRELTEHALQKKSPATRRASVPRPFAWNKNRLIATNWGADSSPVASATLFHSRGFPTEFYASASCQSLRIGQFNCSSAERGRVFAN
jgi:hypothetical protein